jgi:uncharacterized protein (UPF0147 family)
MCGQGGRLLWSSPLASSIIQDNSPPRNIRMFRDVDTVLRTLFKGRPTA